MSTSPSHVPPPWAQSLAFLEGRSVGRGIRLRVSLGPLNRVGALYFQLTAVWGAGQYPLAVGLFHRGVFPAYNWVELVRYLGRAPGAPPIEEVRLFRLLGGLVPAGGSIMVEYESPGLEETAAILALGYPPPCTPLGYALLAAGCLSFRDWYIPEGGLEGPRKLQGFKPLDEGTRQRRAEELLRTLSQVASGRGGGPRQRQARAWARRALRLLRRFP
jgi:hypothetical protein